MENRSAVPLVRVRAMPKDMANTIRPTASSNATTGSRRSVRGPWALYWRTTMSVAAGAVAVAPRTVATPVAAPAPVVQVNPEPAAPQQMGGDPNGTVILGAGGGTTILGEPAAPPMPRAYLTRTKTGEKVEVVGTVFRIGKEIGQVHYCIADNSAVSRSHAEILLEGQTYFLRDLGSTNKTYLDNCVIAPNDKQPLADGASVRLANETFTFTLEG